MSQDDIFAEEQEVDYTPDKRLIDNWQVVLSTPAGRAVVYDLLKVCHFGLSPFSGDNNMTNMIAGKQKVGEEIMSMINSASPASYHLMTKEAQELENYDREQSDNQHSDSI